MTSEGARGGDSVELGGTQTGPDVACPIITHNHIQTQRFITLLCKGLILDVVHSRKIGKVN